MLVKLLGSFAPGHVLSHEGKDFTFSRLDKRMQAALSVDYFKRAREAVYLLKGEVDEEEYGRQLKAVLDAWRKGEYAFTLGSESFAYFVGAAGLHELVMRLTGCKEADALALTESRAVEVLHVCLCLVYECLGEEDKKKLLSQEGTAGMRQLVEILLSRTQSGNGSTSSKPTTVPSSPAEASTPTSSPG